MPFAGHSSFGIEQLAGGMGCRFGRRPVRQRAFGPSPPATLPKNSCAFRCVRLVVIGPRRPITTRLLGTFRPPSPLRQLTMMALWFRMNDANVWSGSEANRSANGIRHRAVGHQCRRPAVDALVGSEGPTAAPEPASVVTVAGEALLSMTVSQTVKNSREDVQSALEGVGYNCTPLNTMKVDGRRCGAAWPEMQARGLNSVNRRAARWERSWDVPAGGFRPFPPSARSGRPRDP